MINLKEIRIAKGITITRLANLLDVSQFSIIRWEQGKTSPSAEKLKKLAELLNVTPNDLLGVNERLAPPAGGTPGTALERNFLSGKGD